jgi:hypothetical protein
MLEPLRLAVKPLGRVWRAWRGRIDRRTAIWGVLLAVFAIVLDFVPLFDVLGYDFSFAIGLAAALAAVDIGHGTVARWRRTGEAGAGGSGQPPAPQTCLRLFGAALAASLAVLALPLLLSWANALRVRNCNLAAGLAFFVLLPVSTVAYAAPAGVIAGLAAKRRGRLLAFAIPALSIVWTLLRLYRDPPVFAFDPFGGYFPGPIYDEALRPPAALLSFRLTNLVWIATAIVLTLAVVGRGRDIRRWRRAFMLGAAPLIAASCLLYAMGGRLEFHVARADLERVLDRKLVTEHFVLRYASGAEKTRADLMLAEEDLEFRYHQLRQTLGVEPKLPITVWEFPSPDVKKALVGAGGTLYAKPWTREVFLQAERFPSRRLRHEMAHVFAGTFGDRLFGIALTWRLWGIVPMPVLASGLVEGIAEAADASDPDGDATIHQEAAAMIAAGLAPPLESVVGAGFTAQAGRRAYTIAGSFTTFLLATRGADKMRALYRSAGNFIDVYRVPLADLEREWRQFLAKQPLTARARAHASEEFRRPAIFKRVCARELAARVAEARAVQGSEPERAVALLESTCRDDPDEPTYRLALAEALAAAGRRDRALTLLGRLEVDRDVTVPLRARAAELAATINFVARDWKNAEAEARRGVEWASSEGDRRQALAKLRALESPAARATLGRALFGDGPGQPGMDPVLVFFLASEYARVAPSDLLGPYLIGRQLLPRDPTRALPYLARACGDEVPTGAPQTLPDEFLRECRRMTADAAYRAGDFARARTALERLGAAAAGEADRLRALDMRARVDWAENRRPMLPSDP